jgi:TonB family protein
MVKRLKITLLALLSLQWGLVAAHSMTIEVFVGKPPGLTKYVYPEYPRSAANYALRGKGLFLLKVNPKTGEVDEVKVLKSTGHVFLNELSAKAFLQWKFQPGVVTQVQVPVEFYAHGFSRDLH